MLKKKYNEIYLTLLTLNKYKKLILIMNNNICTSKMLWKEWDFSGD